MEEIKKRNSKITDDRRTRPPSSTMKILLFMILLAGRSVAGKPHVINFRWPNLFPEGMAWDPLSEHFVVGSLRNRSVFSVSDAGVVQTLISDPTLPSESSILGIAVDKTYHRLLAVIHSLPPLPPFNALAAYDLRSKRRLFLSPLPSDDSQRTTANAVAVDFKGNAYVTDSAGNTIWKVTAGGVASIISRSQAFARHPVKGEIRSCALGSCGLNGIVYVSKGYLLVAQSNTGKMFKVDEEDGTAMEVLLNADLSLGDGVAMRRRDGIALVTSPKKLWFLKSDDSWAEGVVYDKIDLEEEGFATAVAVGGDDRVYVLYGYFLEGIMGNSRDWFRIVEVRSERESGEDKFWVFVMLGVGMVVFMFWRFQMRQLINNMDKKTS